MALCGPSLSFGAAAWLLAAEFARLRAAQEGVHERLGVVVFIFDLDAVVAIQLLAQFLAGDRPSARPVTVSANPI